MKIPKEQSEAVNRRWIQKSRQTTDKTSPDTETTKQIAQDT